MNDAALATTQPRADWVKRFAYRMMLCRNGLDTASAMIVAEIQFGVSQGQDPEDAAERYSGAPTLAMDRRRSPETRRIFGSGNMQGLSDLPFGPSSPSVRIQHATASEPA